MVGGGEATAGGAAVTVAADAVGADAADIRAAVSSVYVFRIWLGTRLLRSDLLAPSERVRLRLNILSPL